MCRTTEPRNGIAGQFDLPEPIINRDPGDETDFDANAYMDGTGPWAGDPIDQLEKMAAMAQDALIQQNDTLLMHGSDLRELFWRTDRLANGLANLAVALRERVEALERPSRRDRFVAWFQEQVYRGPA